MGTVGILRSSVAPVRDSIFGSYGFYLLRLGRGENRGIMGIGFGL